MITITQTRVKDGRPFDQPTLHVSQAKALKHLTSAELGFSGKLTQLEYPSRIVVKTSLLSTVDTSIYEGPEEEMGDLFRVLYFFLKITAEHGKDLAEEMVAASGRLPDGIGGIPLYLAIWAPVGLGESRVKAALLLAMGITEEKEFQEGMTVSIKDLVSIWELRKEAPETPFSELITLI